MILTYIFILALILLPVQIWLCLCSRRRIWKWLPLIGCVAVMVACFLLSFVTDGCAGAGFWVIGCFFVLPVAACGIGWLIAVCIGKYCAAKRQ